MKPLAWNGAVVLEIYYDCKTKVSWRDLHKNYLIIFMKTIALAALTVTSALATPAMAGVYVNAESNASYSGTDYTSRTTDLHIGWEDNIGKLGYYIQGGPSITATDDADGTSNLSGKLGGTVAASEKFDIYGEVSFAQVEDSDNAYGTKIGAKYKF